MDTIQTTKETAMNVTHTNQTDSRNTQTQTEPAVLCANCGAVLAGFPAGSPLPPRGVLCADCAQADFAQQSGEDE